VSTEVHANLSRLINPTDAAPTSDGNDFSDATLKNGFFAFRDGKGDPQLRVVPSGWRKL
jgi:hypothetical protein